MGSVLGFPGVDPTDALIGARIRRWRDQRGVASADLAAALHLTPEALRRADRTCPDGVAAQEGGRSLVATLKRLPRFGNVLRYLIAFMLYNDGLAAIIAFGGVYAAATFGWSTVTLGIFGIIHTTCPQT